MTTLGERILILRRRQDLTQRALARSAGLNSNTLARVERGELKDLSGQLLAGLARALGTTTDFLLGLSEREEREEDMARALGVTADSLLDTWEDGEAPLPVTAALPAGATPGTPPTGPRRRGRPRKAAPLASASS
jgi:transcriptional regulator with XRE-family HTH domain